MSLALTLCPACARAGGGSGPGGYPAATALLLFLPAALVGAMALWLRRSRR